jgi:hypothetical protein
MPRRHESSAVVFHCAARVLEIPETRCKLKLRTVLFGGTLGGVVGQVEEAPVELVIVVLLPTRLVRDVFNL